MATLTTSIADEILSLKRERNAVILAHHYQEHEIQELADVMEEVDVLRLGGVGHRGGTGITTADHARHQQRAET